MTSLNRRQLQIFPLSERTSQLRIERIAVPPEQAGSVPALEAGQVARVAERIRAAREAGGR